MFAACCCFVFLVCTFFACCSVRVAWRALHVACCVRSLHVASFELHGACSGSHVAYIYCGCMLRGRVARRTARALRFAVAGCNDCRTLRNGGVARCTLHVASFALRVAWRGWCVLQRPRRRMAAHAHTPAGFPRSVVPPAPPIPVFVPPAPLPTHTHPTLIVGCLRRPKYT